MTEIISFPKLGLSFSINRIAFSIGGFPVYWYGILFALAFLMGMWYCGRHFRKFGIHPNEGTDVLLWAIVGGVIGARLYYVFFQWDAMYKDNPMKIFAIREGGLAIYGGVIGAILFGLIGSRVKSLPALPVLDCGLTGLLLGQGIGRWGNFFNIEAFGTNTDGLLGMTSESITAYLSSPEVTETLARLGVTVNPSEPVHPTFLYESVWCLAGFLFLAFVITPKRKFDGEVSLFYLIWYSAGRFFIEGMRSDSLLMTLPIGTYRASQCLSGIFCLTALVMLIVGAASKGKLYVNSEASALILAKSDEVYNSKPSSKPEKKAAPAPKPEHSEKTEKPEKPAPSAPNKPESVKPPEPKPEKAPKKPASSETTEKKPEAAKMDLNSVQQLGNIAKELTEAAQGGGNRETAEKLAAAAEILASIAEQIAEGNRMVARKKAPAEEKAEKGEKVEKIDASNVEEVFLAEEGAETPAPAAKPEEKPTEQPEKPAAEAQKSPAEEPVIEMIPPEEAVSAAKVVRVKRRAPATQNVPIPISEMRPAIHVRLRKNGRRNHR